MPGSTAAIDSFFYRLSPDLTMTAWVDGAEPVVLRTKDASGDQFVEGFDRANAKKHELFPVTGPLGIRGVAAGDTVAIELLAVEPASHGHTWTRVGLGFASPIDFHVRRLSSSSPVIDWGSGPAIDVIPQLHVGTVGVLPAVSGEPRSLGEYGGNVDTVHLSAGSTLWLRTAVDGAGIFVGDVHASIGDAEVCGTGIEVASTITLSARVDDSWSPGLPTIRDDGKIWVLADGDNFDEALEKGVRYCTDRLARAWGMPLEDAYLAVGLLLQVEVCQVVNPRRSLAISLASGADVSLGPDWKVG